jgi:hypothetical protein
VILWRFDRRSPRFRQELEAFKEEVWALEQAVVPRALALRTSLRGHLLEVRLIPLEERDVLEPSSVNSTS